MRVRATTGLLLTLEAVGSVVLWTLIPLLWIWVAAQIVDASGSILAGGTTALLGITGSLVLAMRALIRVDERLVAVRGRGALTQIVVASMTVALAIFYLWFYVLSDGAFLIPFMPNQ